MSGDGVGDGSGIGAGRTHILRPHDAPAWAFWVETNQVWGWVVDEAGWRHVQAHYPGRDLGAELRAATSVHVTALVEGVVTGAEVEMVRSFGLRREHRGETLREAGRRWGLEV